MFLFKTQHTQTHNTDACPATHPPAPQRHHLRKNAGVSVSPPAGLLLLVPSFFSASPADPPPAAGSSCLAPGVDHPDDAYSSYLRHTRKNHTQTHTEGSDGDQ